MYDKIYEKKISAKFSDNKFIGKNVKFKLEIQTHAEENKIRQWG
jgi:hypothetical protein